MAFYMHAGHYKPQGTFKSIKYDPLNVHAQDVRCNKWLHGNLSAYATALEKRYGFGILQTLDFKSSRRISRTEPFFFPEAVASSCYDRFSILGLRATMTFATLSCGFCRAL
jgi:hypothetical protein